MTNQLADGFDFSQDYWHPETTERQRKFDDLIMIRTDRVAGNRSKIRAESGVLDPEQYQVLLVLGLSAKYDWAKPFPLSFAAISEKTRPRRNDANHSGLYPKAVAITTKELDEIDLLDRFRKKEGVGGVFWWRLKLPVSDFAPRDPDAREQIKEALTVTRLCSIQAAVYCPLRYYAEGGLIERATLKQMEAITGVYSRTIEKTLLGMLPSALGHCAGIREVVIEREGKAKLFTIKFDWPDDIAIDNSDAQAKAGLDAFVQDARRSIAADQVKRENEAMVKEVKEVKEVNLEAVAAIEEPPEVEPVPGAAETLPEVEEAPEPIEWEMTDEELEEVLSLGQAQAVGTEH